ncbi:hypothetical protein GGX14DRAFT_467173, partial [Mycena pura]
PGHRPSMFVWLPPCTLFGTTITLPRHFSRRVTSFLSYAQWQASASYFVPVPLHRDQLEDTRLSRLDSRRSCRSPAAIAEREVCLASRMSRLYIRILNSHFRCRLGRRTNAYLGTVTPRKPCRCPDEPRRTSTKPRHNQEASGGDLARPRVETQNWPD